MSPGGAQSCLPVPTLTPPNLTKNEKYNFGEAALNFQSLSDPATQVDYIAPELREAFVFDRAKNVFHAIPGKSVRNAELVEIIRVNFSEEVVGSIRLRVEGEKDILWGINIQNPTPVFDLTRGNNTALEKRTSYVLTGNVADETRNELKLSLPFDTGGSVFGGWKLISINNKPPGQWLFDEKLILGRVDQNPPVIHSSLFLEDSLKWKWVGIWRQRPNGSFDLRSRGGADNLKLTLFGREWVGDFIEDHGQ